MRGLVQLSLEIWGVMFCLMAVVVVYSGYQVEKSLSNALMSMLLCAVLIQTCDALAYGFRGVVTPQAVVLTRISNLGVFLFQGVLILAAFSYVSALLRSRGVVVENIWRYFAYAPVGLLVFVLMLNVFVPFLYAFDAQNRYYRTDSYWMILCFGVVALLAVLLTVWYYRRSLRETERLALIFLLLAPITSAVLQWFFYGISLSTFVNTMAVLLTFVCFETDNATRMVQQERMLQQTRMNLLQAQMQPHFMFNSLTTIRSLIKKEPDEAYEAVTEFSGYLRGLLQALNGRERWTLREEMNTVGRYLQLEERRFSDQLQVVLEVEEDGFMVPVLCLQPLVENAVKHGIRQKEGGGTVTIRTDVDGTNYVITVKDDGAGFDTANTVFSKEGNHIGLENVRTRVEQLCGGKMTIKSAVGEGTTVRLILPMTGTGDKAEGASR